MRKSGHPNKPARRRSVRSLLASEDVERMEVDYKGFCKALGAHIKRLRKARGWSSRDMLLIHGVHDGQWRRYERGNGMTIELLLKVAAILGVSEGDLLNGARDSASVGVSDIQARPRSKVAKKAVAKRAARKS